MRFESEIKIRDKEELIKRFPYVVEDRKDVFVYDGREFDNVFGLVNYLVEKGVVEQITEDRSFVAEDSVEIDGWWFGLVEKDGKVSILVETWADDRELHRWKVNEVVKKLAEYNLVEDVSCYEIKQVVEECRV